MVYRSYFKGKMFQSFKDNNPQAIVLYPASNKYNCHSYAWYWRSKSNSYWMDKAGIYAWDGSYRAIGGYPTSAGQKVVWYDYDREGRINFRHSAVVLVFYDKLSPSQIWVESKWTYGPVMIHTLDYSIYGNGPYMFYAEN